MSKLRGDRLIKRIREVANQLLYDDSITPTQINVKEVAQRVPCSRVAIYENNMAAVIRLAQEQKARSAEYSERLKKARKPKLIKLQDRIQELKDENERLKLRHEKLEQLFYRFMINVISNTTKIGIEKEIDDLLTMPVNPLQFKRHMAFARRKKEDYLEKLNRIRSLM